MNQTPSVWAYWGGREETHQECVARTLHFLKAISEVPGLTNWFIPGRSRKESNKPQEFSMEAIGKRMKPIWKRCRGIPAPNLTDELGFRFSAWNGDDEAGASISVRCGKYEPDSPPNSVSLDLPKQPFPGNEESKEKFKRLLNIFVKAFDPDFALVITDERWDPIFADKEIRLLKPGEWEELMFKSAWLLYRRGKPLFVDKKFSDSSVLV